VLLKRNLLHQLKGVVPDSGASGDEFLRMLSALLATDLQPFRNNAPIEE
jgi:hypothetical protein